MFWSNKLKNAHKMLSGPQLAHELLWLIRILFSFDFEDFNLYLSQLILGRPPNLLSSFSYLPYAKLIRIYYNLLS